MSCVDVCSAEVRKVSCVWLIFFVFVFLLFWLALAYFVLFKIEFDLTWFCSGSISRYLFCFSLSPARTHIQSHRRLTHKPRRLPSQCHIFTVFSPFKECALRNNMIVAPPSYPSASFALLNSHASRATPIKQFKSRACGARKEVSSSSTLASFSWLTSPATLARKATGQISRPTSSWTRP